MVRHRLSTVRDRYCLHRSRVASHRVRLHVRRERIIQDPELLPAETTPLPSAPPTTHSATRAAIAPAPRCTSASTTRHSRLFGCTRATRTPVPSPFTPLPRIAVCPGDLERPTSSRLAALTARYRCALHTGQRF